MNTFTGKALSWTVADGVVEVELHREPANEIGSVTLAELERLAEALPALEKEASALLLHSSVAAGFSAGADLRELYRRMMELPAAQRQADLRDFLERIHAALNAIDETSLTTIAATHGVVFGGGFELALVCDIIVADKMSRFCFPELRLGLIPGFGGIPRLKRDLGNGVVRDLLLTGRSLNASRAHAVGLVSQLAAEGRALDAARATARQVGKFDRGTSASAKRFVKPIPYEELAREIDLFCGLFARPAVEEGLRRFVQSEDAMPYLP
ncbi:enoyl-CoA hydratase/isomerase family protein [bacterium]|nr:enoyl-CoA hydratase/isomerase family protein [bacterium]